MPRSACLAIGTLMAFALGLTGCLPNLNESDSAASPLRASPQTEIVPLEEEVAEYPRAFEAQAKQTLNTLQRAQQLYYLERRRFAKSIEALAIGLDMEDDAYIYTIQPSEASGWISMTAAPKFAPLRSYTAAVRVNAAGDRLATFTCESKDPAPFPPSIIDSGEQMSCSQGAQLLK